MKKQIIQLATIIFMLHTGHAYSIHRQAILAFLAFNQTRQQKTENDFTKDPIISITENKDNNDDKENKNTRSYNLTIKKTSPLHSFNAAELAYCAAGATTTYATSKAIAKYLGLPKAPKFFPIRKDLTFLLSIAVFKQYENVNDKFDWEDRYNNFIEQQAKAIRENEAKQNIINIIKEETEKKVDKDTGTDNSKNNATTL